MPGRSNLGFSSHGGTPKWMVCKGKSYWNDLNGWFGGTPISGNLQIRVRISCEIFRRLFCRELLAAQAKKHHWSGHLDRPHFPLNHSNSFSSWLRSVYLSTVVSQKKIREKSSKTCLVQGPTVRPIARWASGHSFWCASRSRCATAIPQRPHCTGGLPKR